MAAPAVASTAPVASVASAPTIVHVNPTTAWVKHVDWDALPLYNCQHPSVEGVATIWVTYSEEALKSRYRNEMPMFLWVQYSTERGYGFQGKFFPTVREAFEAAVDTWDRFTVRGLRDVYEVVYAAAAAASQTLPLAAASK